MASKKQYLYGVVDKDGRLCMDDKAAFARSLAAMRNLPVQVLVERRAKPRSLRENNYYWGVVIALISEWCGYTPEETHDALRAMFLKAGGLEQMPRIFSTTSLTTVEMEDYLRRVREWAAHQGVFIPLPNEQIY